ncbi:MAG TPA: sulfatase [Bacteroidales bacterium]|nr:sulfatase [Bacteroidales bacterium]
MNAKLLTSVGLGALIISSACRQEAKEMQRPNILFAISDDQTWVHTSFAGCEAVNTPAFDWVAKNGVYFENAYCSAPSCSASRASILSGRNGFELEQGADLWSKFPAKFKTYTDILEEDGYDVGYTGKGWGPGSWEESGRNRNPAGYKFNDLKTTPYADYGGAKYISNVDYAANFKKFLDEKPDGTPFSFWFSAFEPHRAYDKGIGKRIGIDPSKVKVPDFLPDNEEVRSDIADYLAEIQYFDKHLQTMIDLLRDRGELDNTIIVVTSDNGMPFPRAKANLYEYGAHLPLAVYWGKNVKGGRRISDLVSFTDFAPTFLEAAGVKVPAEMSGKSLMPVLKPGNENRNKPFRDDVITYRERHAWAHPEGEPTPVRAIRKGNWLLIWNMKPDMWPAGHPDGRYNFDFWPFGDVDNGPSKEEVMKLKHAEKQPDLFALSFGKRPEFELYDLSTDPFQMNNVADDPANGNVLDKMKEELMQYMSERNDPRVEGSAEIFKNAVYYAQQGFHTGNVFLRKWEALSESQKDSLLRECEKEYRHIMDYVERDLYGEK